jgi:hypothetical protein
VAERLAPPRSGTGDSSRPVRPAGQGRAGRLATIRSLLTAENLLVLLLALGVLVVHDVGYLLRQPFWNDEAWVAVTTRFPLSQLAATTSSTPIGWSLLLRVVTVKGSQTARLAPLAFAGLAVAASYWLARGLGWQRRSSAMLAGTLAGISVLLVPAMLVRDDLKQYTADACMALLTLTLTSRLEREWSRRRLALLSVSIWAGLLLSEAVAFTGAAAFAGLFIVQLARRDWRKLAETAITGLATAVLMLYIYVAFYARAATALGASSHWDGFYVPVGTGLHASVAWVIRLLGDLRTDFGLGPAWLAVPLVLAGLVTAARLGRPATALAAAALLPEMLVLSALKFYPFGDLRTSTWLIVVIVVFAAIGVGGIAALLRHWLPAKAGWLAASLVAVAAVAGFCVAASPYVRGHPIPNEDVRDQATYVAEHASPSDVILVNMSSSWGFAYYWPYGQPARRITSVVRQGYLAYFPDQPRIVVAPNRDLAGVSTALRKALDRLRPGSCARIWLIRSHVSTAEQAAWTVALARARLAAVAIGDDGLAELQPGGHSCH